MAFYPVHKELQNLSRNMQQGNFGLWFNKFIPLNNENACKPSDDKDDKDSENRAVDHYFNMYGKMKNNAADMLKRKHNDMDDYCASFPSEKYEEIVICATLTTPLITGIGESHPHEVSLVFDHNMGIPYIPASGIKGIVRFVHTLSLIPEACEIDPIDNKGYFNDEDNWTLIPIMFGTQKNRGKVVFLDAYPHPEKVPDLHIDIMNPHYGPYYSDDKKETPPADHHNPTPIKFLTVAKGTTFIFRAVAEKRENMSEKVRVAFIKALTEEGVGAKTAVGYGRFQIDEKKKEALMADREKRRQQDEDRQFPWRAHLGRIKDIADWGQFKQIILDKGKLAEYSHVKEVADLVRTKALEIRETWRKSWESKRDDEIAIWLSSSGLSWQAFAMETGKLVEEKSEECRSIEGLRDWGAFKSSGLSPEALSPDVLKLLFKKMEEWGCNEKKAKDDKKQAYRHVRDLLKKCM
jgi:CRISPR-associated protein Cmr6